MREELPLVSVIMANFNTKEEYLYESIKSILQQTYQNIELIIVDDASENLSLQVISSFNDERIHLIVNKENVGPHISRNIALDNCNGDYVAIMDADDISLPKRIEKQVDYLLKNPNISIVGSNVVYFGYKNEKIRCKINKIRENLQARLFIKNLNLVHPSVMIRKSFIDKYNIKYDETYRKAQDYRLWVDCIKYTSIGVIDEYLLMYRWHEGQISTNGKKEQDYFADLIRLEQLDSLELKYTEREANIHLSFCNGEIYSTLHETKKWIQKIIEVNQIKNIYDYKNLSNELNSMLFTISYNYIFRDFNYRIENFLILLGTLNINIILVKINTAANLIYKSLMSFFMTRIKE